MKHVRFTCKSGIVCAKFINSGLSSESDLRAKKIVARLSECATGLIRNRGHVRVRTQRKVRYTVPSRLSLATTTFKFALVHVLLSSSHTVRCDRKGIVTGSQLLHLLVGQKQQLFIKNFKKNILGYSLCGITLGDV